MFDYKQVSEFLVGRGVSEMTEEVNQWGEALLESDRDRVGAGTRRPTLVPTCDGQPPAWACPARPSVSALHADDGTIRKPPP